VSKKEKQQEAHEGNSKNVVGGAPPKQCPIVGSRFTKRQIMGAANSTKKPVVGNNNTKERLPPPNRVRETLEAKSMQHFAKFF
jgi:hypothetical protein